MSEELDKILSKAPALQRAFGRLPATLIVLFAISALRPRSGITRLAIGAWLIVAGWFKLHTS